MKVTKKKKLVGFIHNFLFFSGNENFKISQHEKPTDWKKIKVTQIKEIEEKNLMENISKGLYK